MAVQYDTWYYGVFFHPSDPAQDFYYRSLTLPVLIGATGVDLVLFGLQKSSKAEYDAVKALGNSCPGAGNEIPRPTTPVTPTLAFHEIGFVWDSGNQSMLMLARADAGLTVEFYLEPLDGQTAPITGFQYANGVVVSQSVVGVAMNQASAHSAGRVAPGRWTLHVRNDGDTNNDTHKTMTIMLPALTNGGSVQAHSESYFLGGNYAIPEGGSALLALYKYVAGSPTGPTGVGFEGLPSDKSLASSQNGNALTINVPANSVTGDSFLIPLIAKVAGTQVLSQNITVLDKTASSTTNPPVVTPPADANRVDAIAVQTIPNSSDPNSTVTVWLYWKVTGSPVLWVGMYGNNGAALYEGKDFIAGDYEGGYTRALRTTTHTRGNTLRYVARLGSSTGTIVLDKTFDTSFPATGKEQVYSADLYIEANSSDFEGDSSGPSPVTTGDGFDNSYTYSYSGPNADYQSAPIQRAVAPRVVQQQKSKPRASAGRYNFLVQTALNAFLPRRHPEFSLPFSWNGTKLSGWLVPYPGPDFSADRSAVLVRGFNAVAESTPNRPAYGAGKGYFNISGGYDEAKTAAERPGVSAASKAILMRWYDNGQGLHESIVDAAAAELLGIELYTQKQNSDWTSANGGPILAMTLNFEVSVPPAGSGLSEELARMNMIGLVARGVRKTAIAKGHTPPMLFNYDHSGLAFINPQLISRDLPATSGTYGDFGNITYANAIAGLPAYFEGKFLGVAVSGGEGNSPMTASNEMVKYVQEFGGIMGSQEYMNSTWDDQTLWQKNTNGSFKTRTVQDKDGVNRTLLVARTDARRTSIQGEICDLLPPGFYYDGESNTFLQDWYRLSHMGPVEYTIRAGRQHYATSDVRQAGFEKMQLGHWTRDNCEFKLTDRIRKTDGNGFNTNPITGKTYDQEQDALNFRPLNTDFAQHDLIHNLVMCLRDGYRPWSGPRPVIATLGQSLDGTQWASYGNHAMAIYEVYQMAMNRANQFAWVKSNLMQPLWGELAVRNFARDRTWHDINGEFEKKAIVNALICQQRADRNNTPWMVLAGTFPAMDVGTSTALTVWCLNDDGSADGGSYSINMGRNIGIDDFQITASQAAKPPRNWRYRYTDMTGEVRVRAFDYRVANPTTNLTPPAAA